MDRFALVEYGYLIMPGLEKWLTTSTGVDSLRNVTIDIIVCVHNGLTSLQRCLRSVISTISKDHHKLILVDDYSNEETQKYLGWFSNQNPELTILTRTPKQLFYTRAANIGLDISNARLSVLLNSDTVVSRNWLNKLSNLAFSSPLTGIVGPLSNAAHLQSIPSTEQMKDNSAINPLPSGVSVDDMDNLCEIWSQEFGIPYVPFVHGFCLCIKREIIETIGFLEEDAFPEGYGDEYDYCFRAADAGFNHAIAINTYVFHEKSQSYRTEHRLSLMKASYRTLLVKYQDRFTQADQMLKNNPELQGMREKAKVFYSDPGRFGTNGNSVN